MEKHKGNSMDFGGYVASSMLREGLFISSEDTVTIDALVDIYIKKIEKEAKTRGAEELAGKIKYEYLRQASEYVELITKIVDYIQSISKGKFEGKDFKLEASRTNFFFDTKWISVLFIIDSSMETEREFLKILYEKKRDILETTGFIAELLAVNKRSAEVDETAISSDYPYCRTGQINDASCR